MPVFSLNERRVELRGAHHYIAWDATLAGSIILENAVNIWFNVVIRADNDQVTGWFADQLLKSMRKLVAKQVMTGAWPVVSTSAFTDEIEAGTIEGVNEVLASYGAKMMRLGNFDISLLPEDIAKRLEAAWPDVSRGALEAVALEGYREGALSRDQVGRLLGLSLWDTEAFLKERQAYLAYNEEDLEQDRRDLDRIAPQ